MRTVLQGTDDEVIIVEAIYDARGEDTDAIYKAVSACIRHPQGFLMAIDIPYPIQMLHRVH